mmetsp:Transcript_24457/g.36860  ORF Transcript_24457/g.36860 Transcript_24457/m.36860 type:complete len:110 (+) Transcript_24457:382-711(+)
MKDGDSCNIEGEGTRWQHLSNRIVFCGIAFNGKQQRARAQMTRKKRKREGTDLQPHEDSASYLLFFSEASSSVGIGKLAFTLFPRYLRNLLLYVRQLIARSKDSAAIEE